jgi:hypothetical protein
MVYYKKALCDHIKFVYQNDKEEEEENLLTENPSDWLEQLSLRYSIHNDAHLSFCIHELRKYTIYIQVLATNQKDYG